MTWQKVFVIIVNKLTESGFQRYVEIFPNSRELVIVTNNAHEFYDSWRSQVPYL